MGQPGNFLLNRVGVYMFWDSCWKNNFNQKNFSNKVIFLKDLLKIVFTENLFKFFFLKKKLNSAKKKFFLQKKGNPIYINHTKIWFIQFSNYLLISTFFFFLKKKKVKNKFKYYKVSKKRFKKINNYMFFFIKSKSFIKFNFRKLSIF
jgi:hypothetical protein